MSEISEWMDDLHVGEKGNEDDGYEVHYMIDPGDGLCSKLVEGCSEGDAKFIVAACNSHFDLLAALKAVVAVAGRHTAEFDRAREAIAKAERQP